MSLRGVGKALYRTPHQLFGQKTGEDVIYKQWESDIKTALAGLQYLKSENQKWKKFWIATITNFIQILDIFRDLHCQIEHHSDNNEKPIDKNEEFTSVTFHELAQAGKLAKIILDKTTQMSDDSSNSFTSKCNDMIDTLKGAEKLITKRNHKKIDYEMKTNKVNSLLKGSLNNDKDKAKLESDKAKLTESEIIYKDLNDKIKLIIPEILSTLSEFINKLSFKLYYSNLDILDFIQKNLEKFNRVHGIASDSKFLIYEDIIADFNSQYSQAQSKLENLSLLKEFRSFRNKNITEKTVQQVNNVTGTVVDSTVNFTSTIYTKASKPNQRLSVSLNSFKIDNPVQTYDKHGMFTTALDPIDFVKNADFAMNLTQDDLNALMANNNRNNTEDTSSDVIKDENEEGETVTGEKGTEKENIIQDVGIDSEATTESSSVREEKVSVAGTEWMKPLRNSTLIHKVTSPQPTPTANSSKIPEEESESISPTAVDSTTNTTSPLPKTVSSDGKYAANSRVSSLTIDANTETYRYVNITMDNITKRLYLVVTNPEIHYAPVTTKKSKINIVDYKVKDYYVARSSITANAFAAYATI